jgi:excisionase family DNA binding protein
MELLTVTEASAKKKVNPSRIRALILEGKLEAEKFGKTWLIKEADLEKLVIYGKAGRPKKEKE